MTVEDILDVEYSEDDALAAAKFLERFDHPTTCVAALCAALGLYDFDDSSALLFRQLKALAALDAKRE